MPEAFWNKNLCQTDKPTDLLWLLLLFFLLLAFFLASLDLETILHLIVGDVFYLFVVLNIQSELKVMIFY